MREGQGRAVETWGHRGASAAFRESSSTLILVRALFDTVNDPAENTLASFAKACQDGADGIETGALLLVLPGKLEI